MNQLASPANSFLDELREQRFDDHRYYHQCRINQSLHFVSAMSFLGAYVTVAFDPVLAVGLGWLVSMTTRQAGHFFFEPKGYDRLNDATHAHKESIKVGYNLNRKIWLLSTWALAPLLLVASPSLFGLLRTPTRLYDHAHNVAVMWLWIGAAALVARTLWLCAHRSVQTGLAWFTKILTDPFHDVMLYWRAPLHLLRGERYDPMSDVAQHLATRAAPGA